MIDPSDADPCGPDDSVPVDTVKPTLEDTIASNSVDGGASDETVKITKSKGQAKQSVDSEETFDLHETWDEGP